MTTEARAGAPQERPGAPLLEVRSLATGYGDLRAVFDVSLDVMPGSVTAVLGRNGAGKTTTLRAVAGLNPTSSGSILLEGEPLGSVPAHARARRGIAYVQEGKRIFRNRTVEENLLLGTYAHPHPKLARAHIAEQYDRFPILAERRKRPAASLSGGQQQMLAIAQAVVAGPKVLLLDEPSAGLAPSVVADVRSVIDELRSSGLGVLLVEQAMELALSLADRVVVLDLGRTVYRADAGAPNLRQAVRVAYAGATVSPAAG